MIHGLNNKFFIGVVEDRHDPEQMGRVRVRVFSLHNADRKVEIPIEDLPWSMVLHSGLTPTAGGNVAQIKEGKWVLVMYLDQNYQESIVLGSLPNRYDERPDYEEGLSDPFGVYPRYLDETILVTRESEWTKHPTYDQRSKFHVENVPKARRFATPTVSTHPEEPDWQHWDEHPLRGDQDSQYPYNAVREFESGAIEEYDSTPDNSRITKMHRSGTYEEILHMGDRTLKIVGDGYHITVKDQNMYVEGDLNITVGGDMRQFVNGDYILEVNGDYSMKISGDRQAKINGDDVKEVLLTESSNIGKNHYYRSGEERRFLSVDISHHEAQKTFFIVGGPDIQLNP